MRSMLRVALALGYLQAVPSPIASVPAAAQERTLPVPPNVTAEGVPPIPVSLADAIAPYGQFRRARLVAWHPTERRLIVATRFGETLQLHDVRSPGGARRQLTFFRDGVVGSERQAAGGFRARRPFVRVPERHGGRR